MGEAKEQLRRWRDHTVEYYDRLVAQRGEGWQAFWGSQRSQLGRYQVFFKHLPLDGASVIEIGCGFGDLLTYAQHKGVRFSRYLGVDLSARMVAAARRRHPEQEFAVFDILERDPPFLPDFIVASGITAVAIDGYERYVLGTLRRFHALARQGFGINFLSACTKAPDPACKYVEPWWLLQLFQSNIDWNCRLIHDYRPNDFTLIHHKSP